MTEEVEFDVVTNNGKYRVAGYPFWHFGHQFAVHYEAFPDGLFAEWDVSHVATGQLVSERPYSTRARAKRAAIAILDQHGEFGLAAAIYKAEHPDD